MKWILIAYYAIPYGTDQAVNLGEYYSLEQCRVVASEVKKNTYAHWTVCANNGAKK